VIGFVQWIDDCDFKTACKPLTEPQRSNSQSAETRKVRVKSYQYDDNGGAVAFVVDRFQFQTPDGSFVLTEDGKPQKTFSQRRPDPRGSDSWLKNIARPVRVYAVILDRKSTQSEPIGPTLALPDKPSIAVLPFQNMGSDPEQEYFADGMVEEIITMRGTSRPSNFAVFKLTIVWYFTGACTGRSAGFSPRKMRST
jgi:hypothetical protein